MISTARRRGRAPWAAAVVLCTVWSVLIGTTGTSDAWFTAKSTNPANTFAADTLDPTGSFASNRPCTPLDPAYRDSATKTTIGGSSLVFTTPATATGDYLIMSVTTYESGTGTPQTITTPTDWDLLRTSISSGADYKVRLAVFAMAAPASANPTYTVGLGGPGVAVGTLTSYSGIASVASHAVAAGVTATATAPTLTASSGNQMLLAVYAHSGTTSTTPADMTSSAGVDGFGAGQDTYHELRAAAGATGSRSSIINATNPAWVAVSVLLVGAGTGKDPTIQLSWTATPDTWATGYEIIRTGGPTTAVAGRATVAWNDTTKSASTGYTYTISAAYGTWRLTTRQVVVSACP